MTIDLDGLELRAKSLVQHIANQDAQSMGTHTAELGVDPATILELVRLARVGRQIAMASARCDLKRELRSVLEEKLPDPEDQELVLLDVIAELMSTPEATAPKNDRPPLPPPPLPNLPGTPIQTQQSPRHRAIRARRTPRAEGLPGMHAAEVGQRVRV